MTGLRLYEWYPVERAVSFFGTPTDFESLCDGQWLISPTTVICFSCITEGEKTPYFDNGAHFCWVGKRPSKVSSEGWANFAPAAVVGAKNRDRSIRLFVRPLGASDYMYLGELEPSYMQVGPDEDGRGMARFALRTTLPSDIWLRLVGVRLGSLDSTMVDRAFERMRGPTTVEDRLGVLRQLVEFWHGPIGPEDGMVEAELAGVSLPRPLRWWYRWAGRRTEVLSGQNTFFRPRDEQYRYRQLSLADGLLSFHSENQGTYHWSTLPEGDDPPVFGRCERTDPWEREDMTLSEHLILTCFFEAVICHAKYGASGVGLEDRTYVGIARRLPRLAIAPWRWFGMKFFAGHGAFMCVTDDGAMWIGAKTEQPLQFLEPYRDDCWEYKAF